MRKFALTVVFSLAMVGLATAADVTVNGVIIKVDKKGEGAKVEYTVLFKPFPKKKGEKVEPVTRKVAAGCVVARVKPGADDPKKLETIDNGLGNDCFPTKEADQGAVARITIDQDKGTITQLLVLTYPAKKKDGK
jgi:hypothetical protein